MNDQSNSTALAPVDRLSGGGAYKEIGFANTTAGGLAIMPRDFQELVSFAQLMAKSGPMLRPHFRDEPGACLAIATQALRWNMDPWAVGNKTFFVNDQIAYEAQLLAAVIINSGMIEDLPEYEFEGDGPNLRCTVTCIMKKTGKAKAYRSPLFKDILPKNSPLWKTDPEQQLGYYSIRGWGRRHTPHLILGVYDREEVEAFEPIKTVGDNRQQGESLKERLAANAESPAPVDRAFDANFVEESLGGKATVIEATAAAPQPAKRGRAPKAETKTQEAAPEAPTSPTPASAPVAAEATEEAASTSESAPADESSDIGAAPANEPAGASADGFDFEDCLTTFKIELTKLETIAALDDFGSRVSYAPDGWYVAAPQDIQDEARAAFESRKEYLHEAEEAASHAAKQAAKQQPEEAAPAAPQEPDEPAEDPRLAALVIAGEKAATEGLRRFKLFRGKLSQSDFDLLTGQPGLNDRLEKMAREADESL